MTLQGALHHETYTERLLWVISGSGVTPAHVRSSLETDIRQREWHVRFVPIADRGIWSNSAWRQDRLLVGSASIVDVEVRIENGLALRPEERRVRIQPNCHKARSPHGLMHRIARNGCRIQFLTAMKRREKLLGRRHSHVPEQHKCLVAYALPNRSGADRWHR
jgi:hypothetical protein